MYIYLIHTLNVLFWLNFIFLSISNIWKDFDAFWHSSVYSHKLVKDVSFSQHKGQKAEGVKVYKLAIWYALPFNGFLFLPHKHLIVLLEEVKLGNKKWITNFNSNVLSVHGLKHKYFGTGMLPIIIFLKKRF